MRRMGKKLKSYSYCGRCDGGYGGGWPRGALLVPPAVSTPSLAGLTRREKKKQNVSIDQNLRRDDGPPKGDHFAGRWGRRPVVRCLSN
ncbi:hypothetical protein EVAR_25663_1 [Eumeta japonica]|uniref:Uncharacterized protein n=1 Tax=Eumeta variegata TaxID=151549 RepID=A0A4C1WGD7_EUMVA|nr:hypothetical protein EVAR_25663_1 [Eumeta japonica]